MNKEIIAAFDFDGTLTTGLPSRMLFLKQLIGLPNLLKALVYLPFQHRKRNEPNKADYLDVRFLKGRDKQELCAQAEIFLQQVLLKKLRPEALECLEFHQNQGHTCIIISGAWDVYLKPLAQQYHFKNLICTELEFDPLSNKSTGRMRNRYCLGANKVEEFKKIYPNRDDYIIYAYGDSRHDIPLLDYADFGFYKCFK